MTTRDDLIARYSAYLEACNQRAWDHLPRFLAHSVVVNGDVQTPSEYVKNVMTTTATFPDYRWELRRAVVEGEWLAVHLHDRGTRTGPFRGAPGDGAQVETDEFNLYRIATGSSVRWRALPTTPASAPSLNGPLTEDRTGTTGPPTVGARQSSRRGR